ncbi:MAG: tetratricopeptide repeat protein [Parachlamydiaceae bacterium]|nr:tetratricopeptide repeat protein [Parachlamydiaceae bacterium]
MIESMWRDRTIPFQVPSKKTLALCAGALCATWYLWDPIDLLEKIKLVALSAFAIEAVSSLTHQIKKSFNTLPIDNCGPYLKIFNQMVQSHSKNADEASQIAFKHVEEGSKEEIAFEAIRNKLKSGLIAEAKKELGKLLKAIEDQDLDKSIKGFQLMSEIHLEEGKYLEAAGILWYAKYLDKEGISHKKIDAQLDKIEHSFLRKATNQKGLFRGIEQSKLDQEKLRQVRETIKEEYQSIQLIEDNLERAKAFRFLYQQTITKKLKAFIDEIAQDVVKQMAEWEQKTPCDYALIGLGSLAREEMTPYSDFEFAILIDSEKEEDKEYFRLFTNLLHLRFINLGETLLPSLNINSLDWVYDTITPRGLSFDGSMPKACKTPLGKKNDKGVVYELIHNPEKMSQLQFIDVKESSYDRLWVLKKYHLPSILSACTFVTGSEKGLDLVSEYKEKVQNILEKDEGKQRAFDLMKDDLDNFKPNIEEESSGKHYNVKIDLYRLPNTMFDGLANYYCLNALSTWERIEELEERGIFTSKAAQDLKEMVMLSQELRLSTYISHNRQKDHLHINNQKDKLQELYFRALPFAATMENFCSEMKNGCPEICLKLERFYDNSFFNQGIIALRHMDYLEAHRCLSIEILDTLEYYEILGYVKKTLGKYGEAEKAYLKALEKKPSCDLYMKLGSVRQSLARYKKEIYGEESAEETLFKALELAEISEDQLTFEKVYRALTDFYHESGDHVSVRKYLSLCKENSEKRIQGKCKDPEYGIVLDLDLARTKSQEASILYNVDSEFEKGGKLYHEAKKNFQGYYRRKDHPAVLNYYNEAPTFKEQETLLARQKKTLKIQIEIFGEKHPDVANSYINIGSTFGKLGLHQKALGYMEKALEIGCSIFCEEHPTVASSYFDVGTTFKELGQYQEALKYHQKALEIYLSIFVSQHPDVASAYNAVGCVLECLGRNQEALETFQKALKMLRSIFGKQHLLVADSYINIGGTMGKLGRHKEALRYLEKALEIQRSIFGGPHPVMAGTYSPMGVVFGYMGRHQEALEVQEKALEMRRSIFGEQHPQVARAYHNVGFALGDLGRHHEALEYMQKALKMLLSIFNKQHPHVVNSYKNVGCTLEELGRHQEALEYKQIALEILRSIFGEEHPGVASSYTNVGITLLKLKKYILATSKFKQALSILQGNPSYQVHLEIVNIHNYLAISYFQQNNTTKYTEHIQESNKLSRELSSVITFEKNEVLLKDFLHNKEYRKAYNAFKKVPKHLKEAPQFLCSYMQIALLCPDLNKKTLEKHIQSAENALNKGEGSIPTRFKLCINLATYWLNQQSPQKWEKANDCINHSQKLLEIAPTFCFQYTLLDSLVFGENPLIKNECIPAEILRNFFALKIFQGKGNHQILPTIAKQLLQKMDSLATQGHKAEEIKDFCLKCLK